MEHVTQCLQGKRVVFTGVLSTMRPLFQALIEQACGITFEDGSTGDVAWCLKASELSRTPCEGAILCLDRSGLPWSTALLQAGDWDIIVHDGRDSPGVAYKSEIHCIQKLCACAVE